MPSSAPRYRNLIFTINNPEFSDTEPCGYVKPTFSDKFSYLAYALEEGETVHWQGYVEFHHQLTKDTFYREIGLVDRKCFCDPRKAKFSKDARAYVFKQDETFRGVVEEYGMLSTMGERLDIQAYVQKIKDGEWNTERDILMENPYAHWKFGRTLMTALKCFGGRRDRTTPSEVELIIGGTGTGKTRYVYDNYGDDLYDKPLDEKGVGWWDGYYNQSVVLFDEFRGQIEVGEMLKILDRYPKGLSVKGTSGQLTTKKFIITTNEEPRDWYDWRHTREATWAAWERRITKKTYL